MEQERAPILFTQGIPGCLVIFAAATAAVVFIRVLDLPVSSISVPAIWGVAALWPGWKGHFPPPVIGFGVPVLKKGIRLLALSTAIVFPLYALLFYTYTRLGFSGPPDLLPQGVTIFRWSVYNLAVVAFTEELFFRGYLQGRFEERVAKPHPGSRAVFWMPVIASASLFAVAHAAADLDMARMVVFFPGLLFGWLRARTGAVLASVLCHGSANLLSMLLIRSMVGQG